MYLKTKIVEIAEKVQDVYKKLDSRILSLGNSTGSIAPMISIKNSSSDSLVQEKSGANTETVIGEQMRGTKRKSNSMDNEGASTLKKDGSYAKVKTHPRAKKTFSVQQILIEDSEKKSINLINKNSATASRKTKD